MRSFWSDTRPNGQPVEAGTVCFITDLEDGTLPIPTYGRTQEEVLQKLALQNAHAQLEIARRSSSRPAAQPAPPPPPVKRIGPDQVMQATADLRDPAKAGQAISTLFESATGISPERIVLQNFGALAATWEQKNPDFYPHNGNRRLVAQAAAEMAGGLGQVTEAHLDNAFDHLRSSGDLFEAPLNGNEQPSLPAFPGENQVQRGAERPRTRFATGSRSTTFRPQAPTRTYKYTEEELRTMPMSKSRRLIETNDRDYADAMEHFFGGSTAQAR